MIKFTFYNRNCNNVIKLLKEGDKIWINNYPRTVKRVGFRNREVFSVYLSERVNIGVSISALNFSKSVLPESFEYKFIEESSGLIINRTNRLWVSFDPIKSDSGIVIDLIEKASNKIEDFSLMSVNQGIGTNSELVEYNLHESVIRDRLGLFHIPGLNS